MFDKHIREIFCSNKKPQNLKDFNIPLTLLVPRADYFLTQKSRIENVEFNKELLNKYFKDGLLCYLNTLYDQGYLNRNGITSNPIDYTLKFDRLKLKYIWIPKNACTFTKKQILLLTDKEFLRLHDKNIFHESVQEKYGFSMLDYIDHPSNNSYPSFAVLRDPIERFISCYTDKFVLPALKGKDFEGFAYDVILKIIEISGQPRRPSDSVSFREFLEFVKSQPPYELNEHWRPQYAFLGNETLALCTTKNLDFELPSILNESKTFLPERENKSFSLSFSEKKHCSGRFRNSLPKELELQDLKDYGDFLSHEDHDYLAELYKKDFLLYEQASSPPRRPGQGRTH